MLGTSCASGEVRGTATAGADLPWSIQTGPFRPCLACPLGALLPPACPLPACCLPASHDSKKASLPSLRSSLRWPACYGTAISVGRQSNARGLLLRRKWSGATGVSSTSGLHWRCTTRWRRPTSASSGLSCRHQARMSPCHLATRPSGTIWKAQHTNKLLPRQPMELTYHSPMIWLAKTSWRAWTSSSPHWHPTTSLSTPPLGRILS